MTLAGWIFMAVSVTFVVGLCGWCYYQVLREPRDAREPGPPGSA